MYNNLEKSFILTFLAYFSSIEGDNIEVGWTRDSGIGGCLTSPLERPRPPDLRPRPEPLPLPEPRELVGLRLVDNEVAVEEDKVVLHDDDTLLLVVLVVADDVDEEKCPNFAENKNKMFTSRHRNFFN